MMSKVELIALSKKESEFVQTNSLGLMYIATGESREQRVPVVNVSGTDVFLAAAVDGKIATAKSLIDAGFASINDAITVAAGTSQDEAIIADVNEMFAGNTGSNGKLLCLTTNNHRRGASVLAMPVLFRDLAKKLECRGMYVLPSSIDEILVAIDLWGQDEKIDAAMKAMVMAVNQEQVPEDMVLSNNAFYYDAEDGTLRTVGID
jgi:hypothetical protein